MALPRDMPDEQGFDSTARFYRYRIPYPPELFVEFCARLGVDESTRVLDLCTGNGEIATALADHVGSVVGVDASSPMLAQAMQHPRVRYLLHDINSEALPETLSQRDFGLLTIGRAIHWLAPDSLRRLVESSLAPGAGIAILGAGWSGSTPWLGTYRALIHRYRSAPSPDFRGLEKLARLGAQRIEVIDVGRTVRCSLDHLVRHALSYSNSTQAILSDLAAFRAELASLLAPYVQSGMVTGSIVGWAEVHRMR